MAGKTKLELTWIGKDIRPRLEPRILIEEPEFSHHADTRKEGDIFDNMLIHGDNLLALKALEADPAVRGNVKCVFIDPPYNTGSAFEHYDDGLEHSLWLSTMRDRLELLRNLLSEDGFIFVQIDYRESARLKLLLDEVFGMGRFRNEIIVGRGTKNVQSQFKDINSLSSGHDSIYLYGKSSASRLPTLFSRSQDSSPGKWDTFWRGTDRPTMRYELFGIIPERGQWRWSKDRAYSAKDSYEEYLSKYSESMSLDEYWNAQSIEKGEDPNFIRLGPDGNVQYYVGPRDYKLLSDVWLDIRTLGKQTDFPHEKHEELLERIISWVTRPGDIVLDSFAGSGSTGATAHKLGRRWIMVELGDHAKTHIVPRMKRIVDGTDRGGITETSGWSGGGGYRFVRLAPSLLKKDAWGNWVIADSYNPAMLAEAMCKHFGFTYAPSTEHYWMHGSSSETSYIYVTTASLTHVQLRALSDEVGDGRSLLICCTAFEGDHVGDLTNLTIRKIPGAVLDRCEWGKDDYSLKIESLPMMADEDEADGDATRAPGEKPKTGNTPGAVGDLFADEGE